MDIGTMSAEELALSFSTVQNQNQNNNPPNTPINTPPVSTTPIEVATKSSEELALEMAENAKVHVNEDGTPKTPEQIKADEDAAKVQADLEAKKNPGGRPKTKLDDSFKQGLDKLFKEQKLNPYSDGTETGYIIPDTWEEVVELIEDNKKDWTEASKAKDKQELFEEILATKSPAWQFVIENSQSFKDPADLIPLLTAVQNIEYSAALDPEKPEDQEKIIRASLSIQGIPTESIESEIEDLKERGKLQSRSVDLKPVLDKYNQAQAAKILEEKEVENKKKEAFWNDYWQSLETTVIKAKELDGVKLKNEHKQLIASAIIPNEEIGGLPIYTMIDKLVAEKNFKALSKIVLIGTDEKIFDTYFLTEKVENKVDKVQKVLRKIGTTSTPAETDVEDTTKPRTIKKSGYGYFG